MLPPTTVKFSGRSLADAFRELTTTERTICFEIISKIMENEKPLHLHHRDSNPLLNQPPPPPPPVSHQAVRRTSTTGVRETKHSVVIPSNNRSSARLHQAPPVVTPPTLPTEYFNVHTFLSDNGLKEYSPLLERKDVKRLSVLKTLSESDFVKLGMKAPHAKKVKIALDHYDGLPDLPPLPSHFGEEGAKRISLESFRPCVMAGCGHQRVKRKMYCEEHLKRYK